MKRFFASASALVAVLGAAPASTTLTMPETLAWLHASARIVVSSKTMPGESTAAPYAEVAGTHYGGFFGRAERGTLRNGRVAVVMELASGGTMGVADAFVFTTVNGARRFVGVVPSPNGHLGVRIVGGRIEATTPKYGVGDATCCPSAYHVQDFSLDGIRLVSVAERDVAAKDLR